MATLLTKKSDTASSVPLAADLTNAAGGAELAVNTADKRLYSKTPGGTVVELGTNPSSMTLLNGTANGVPYLNGSKVLTSGSALTFDGAGVLTVSSAVAQMNLTPTTNTNNALYRATNAGGTAFIGLDSSAGALGAAYGLSLYHTGNYPIVFSTNGSEQMRLTSTGLGIGTSSPDRKLSLYTVDATGKMALFSNGNTNTNLYLSSDPSSGGAVINVSNNAATAGVPLLFKMNGTEISRFDTFGNLGLGVTPSAWLSSQKALEVSGWSVNAAGVTSSVATNAYVNSSSSWIYKATGYATRYDNVSGQHQWYTAPSGTAGNAISFTQAMTLDASGNLLVGKTASSNYGDGSQIYPAGTIGLGHPSGTGSSAAYALFGYAGTGIGSITQNGTTGVLYNMVSDHRLKTVIGSVTDSGARIDALEPIEYEWKSDGSRTRGFLAHKFQEVYAGSVTGSKDAVDKDGKPVYQAMQASSAEVIADLVAEIQSLRKRLAAAGV